MTATEPKPIAPRQVSKGDRAALVAAIGGDLRVGILDGVSVDFSHPDLPPEDWEAPPWWDVWGETPDNAGLVFPGEAKFGMKALREAKGMAEDAPAVFALAGDRISIASVVFEIGDRRFDHPHDSQRRLAFLKVERPTGEVLEAGPLAFYGKTRIQHHGTRHAFDHIIGRILHHAEVTAFPAPRCPVDGSLWDRPLEQIALHIAQEAHSSYFNLAAALSDSSMGHIRRLANDAALAGFLLGKVEARKAERIAGSTMANLDKGTLAGKRHDWREAGLAIWAEHPDWKRTRVATRIVEDFPDAEVRSIIRALKEIDPHLKP